VSESMKLMDIEQIAKTIHYGLLQYCETLKMNISGEYWDECTHWYKKTLMWNVDQVITGSPSMSPERTHENWMTEQLVDGWKYAATYNEEKKEHPFMLPYRQLPDEGKGYVLLFLSMAKAARKFIKENEDTANEAGEGI